MSDLGLTLNKEEGTGDLTLKNGEIATDAQGLKTAVIVSLLSDARAKEDQPLPDGSNKRRGWWDAKKYARDGTPLPKGSPARP